MYVLFSEGNVMLLITFLFILYLRYSAGVNVFSVPLPSTTATTRIFIETAMPTVVITTGGTLCISYCDKAWTFKDSCSTTYLLL